jgi:protein-S-isoprenylcysteine O-methyltransferase Ste14
MVLLWVVLFTSISAGIWFSQVQGSNLPGGAHWLKWFSLSVLIFGLLLRWSAVLSLGKAFSSNVAITSEQKVLKTGLYRWMRHPSYTGLLICIYAVALHTRNWISMLIIAIPCTAALLYRIQVEEIALREHFGVEYEEYGRVTKRLIPGVY